MADSTVFTSFLLLAIKHFDRRRNKLEITFTVEVSRVPYRESHTSTSSPVHPTVEATIQWSPRLWMTWSWFVGGTLALGLYWRSVDCRPFTPGNCFFNSDCAKSIERSDNYSPLLILLTSVLGKLSLSFFLGGSFSLSAQSFDEKARFSSALALSTSLWAPVSVSVQGTSSPPWGRSSE